MSAKVSDIGCSLHSMYSFTEPRCAENGGLKNIRDDENPGKCGINKKRSDGFQVWSAELSSYVSYREYRLFHVSVCVSQGAHGGHNCTDRQKTVEHILWRSGPVKNWFDAQSECGLLSGHLFDNLNGTRTQLELLSFYMNYTQFWLGISDGGPGRLWRNSKGDSVEHLLFWALHQPDGHLAENYLTFAGQQMVAGIERVYSFHDVGPWAVYTFPCQLVP